MELQGVSGKVREKRAERGEGNEMRRAHWEKGKRDKHERWLGRADGKEERRGR